MLIACRAERSKPADYVFAAVGTDRISFLLFRKRLRYGGQYYPYQ
jgi:hypothetical protein